MAFGTAVHEALLEPHEFEKYQPKLNWTKTTDEKVRQQKIDVVEGKIKVISKADFDRIDSIKDAVENNESIKNLIENSEKEVIATALINDLFCKAKADIIMPGFIADIKTTAQIPTSEGHAQAIINKYDYDLSGALYNDVFTEAAKTSDVYDQFDFFVWIFIESSPPYKIVVVQAPTDGLVFQSGREKYQKALQKIKKYQNMSVKHENLVLNLG